MRIALCLHGYFNNRADKNAGTNGFYHLQERVMSLGDVDVFFHSWDVENQDAILGLYSKPKEFIIEPQAQFLQLEEEQKRIDEGLNRATSKFASCKLSSTLSFLYSRKKAIELKQQEEDKTGLLYDVVITSRFDAGQRDKFGKWKYYVSRINFSPSFDMNYVYSAMWDQLNAGYADQWLYSNSLNMDIVATLYDKCFEYFREGSDYEKMLTTGWRDSVPVNNMDSRDPGQFTNECLQKHKSRQLMKYPKWQMINNHLLYKFFMIDTGLYEKSRFVDEEYRIYTVQP